MNQPKKRGRPAKMQETVSNDPQTQPEQPQEISEAQAYANRILAGQSDSVPRSERLRRVELALKGQNLPYEGVTL
jgi:hypothetical protein